MLLGFLGAARFAGSGLDLSDSFSLDARPKPPNPTHKPLSSSFLELPHGILNINHKKELLRGLWVNPIQSEVAIPTLQFVHGVLGSRGTEGLV